jgi:hypothetical protein
MKTESTEYYKYLKQNYLPGRSLFLKLIYYPRIFNEFKSDKPIWDFGCGMGKFLSFCNKKGRIAKGIDSNQNFVLACKKKGFFAEIDDVCQLKTIPANFIENALIDNVLEHLTETEINLFFDVFKQKAINGGILVCIVPGEKGFKRDPTHKTYVNDGLLLSVLENKRFKIINQYHHPFPFRQISKLLYLNMQVFILKKHQ